MLTAFLRNKKRNPMAFHFPYETCYKDGVAEFMSRLDYGVDKYWMDDTMSEAMVRNKTDDVIRCQIIRTRHWDAETSDFYISRTFLIE